MSINFIPDLPRDFNRAERLIQFGGTIMGIFKINGGKLEVAYSYREWREDRAMMCRVFTPVILGDPAVTGISNILEGMVLLIKKDAQEIGTKIHAVVAGRAFILRLFAEGKIVDNSLLPTEHGRFQGQVVIGDETYILLAEETKHIFGSDIQIAFVDEDLKIIGKNCL